MRGNLRTDGARSPYEMEGGSGSEEPESQEPYIQCRDLFKIYKRAELEVVALRGVDLDVEAGELIAIIGTSGSGKSTLLNTLAGLDSPSAGQVRVCLLYTSPSPRD